MEVKRAHSMSGGSAMAFGRAVAWWTGVDVVLSPLGFLPVMGIRRQGPVTGDHDRQGTST